VGDFNHDGRTDLLAGNWQTGEVKLFAQEQQQRAPSSAVKLSSGITALAAADLFHDRNLEIGAYSGTLGRFALTAWRPDKSFAPVLSVTLPGAGGQGQVFPWTSAEAGPGFVVSTPLAEAPLQFIACHKDALAQPGTALSAIPSNLDDVGVLGGVAPVT